HSTAGAFYAARKDSAHALPISFAIAGHHAGLADHRAGPSSQGLANRLREKGQARLDAALAMAPPAEILCAHVPNLSAELLPTGSRDHDTMRRVELFTRMIFSALCDADFLDTEAFFDQSRAALRGGHQDLNQLRKRLKGYVDRLASADG